jgi:hypothetical protein
MIHLAMPCSYHLRPSGREWNGNAQSICWTGDHDDRSGLVHFWSSGIRIQPEVASQQRTRPGIVSDGHRPSRLLRKRESGSMPEKRPKKKCPGDTQLTREVHRGSCDFSPAASP